MSNLDSGREEREHGHYHLSEGDPHATDRILTDRDGPRGGTVPPRPGAGRSVILPQLRSKKYFPTIANPKPTSRSKSLMALN